MVNVVFKSNTSKMKTESIKQSYLIGYTTTLFKNLCFLDFLSPQVRERLFNYEFSHLSTGGGFQYDDQTSTDFRLSSMMDGKTM